LTRLRFREKAERLEKQEVVAEQQVTMSAVKRIIRGHAAGRAADGMKEHQMKDWRRRKNWDLKI
jgi:hypothetical protein